LDASPIEIAHDRAKITHGRACRSVNIKPTH